MSAPTLVRIGQKRRLAIEQAIARGHDLDRVVKVTGEDARTVGRVWADMDQAAAELESA